jgi:malic enzyme
MAALRHLDRTWREQRILLAGAARIGIAGLLRAAMLDAGLTRAMPRSGLPSSSRAVSFTLAPATSSTDFATSPRTLYPPISRLRDVSRRIALAVAREAIGSGLSRVHEATLEARIDAAMWWPGYVPYRVAPTASPQRT